MDVQLLEDDLVKAFREVPKDFVEDVARVLMAHDLRDIWPRVAPHLTKHVRALVFEGVSGMLDEKEIESAIRGAAAQVGVKLPDKG
jgi:hypothetical protein